MSRKPSFEYNLDTQTKLQLICAPLFLSISISQWTMCIAYNPPNSWEWDYSTFAISMAGTIASAVQFMIILKKKCRVWLLMYIGYLVCIFMPYRVVYLVFGMRFDAEVEKVLIEMTLTGTLIVVGWIQIYSTVLIGRLWRFFDVFRGHPRCHHRRVPLEDLAGMMHQLNYHPSAAQMVTLMAVFPPGTHEIRFDEFCLALEHWARARRKRHRRQQQTGTEDNSRPKTPGQLSHSRSFSKEEPLIPRGSDVVYLQHGPSQHHVG